MQEKFTTLFGTALSWLTGTATTKDIHSIRARINQLIVTQSSQCDTLVHIVSILNVTRYATQVNRHSINSLIDAVHSAAQDIDNLFNVTSSLVSSINFNQMTLHLRSVFANLRDTMKYLHTISTHTIDCIDAATSGKLSPHILPVADLQQMLTHIATTLPPTLHLPISPTDTLHFYRYLHAHVLIENKQFLLLIDIPIQDRPDRSPFNRSLPWTSLMEIIQCIMTSTHSTSESPQMPQWDWNYPLHNLKFVNRLMVNSATFPHPFNPWLIHQHASPCCMPRTRPT